MLRSKWQLLGIYSSCFMQAVRCLLARIFDAYEVLASRVELDLASMPYQQYAPVAVAKFKTVILRVWEYSYYGRILVRGGCL